MNRRLLVLIVVCVSLLVSPSFVAFGQRMEREEGARLSLAQCLRIALRNNLDLVSARRDPEISQERVDQQLASFDPSVFATFFGLGFETEPSDEFTSAGIGDTLGGRGQVTRQFQFGGDIDARLTTTRRAGAGSPFFIDPVFDPLGIGLDEPFYQSTLEATFNLPLLRGRGKLPTTEQLQLARGDLEISREELRRQAELTLETVEGAYWNLVASRQALVVARQSLKRAEDLLKLNRKKVEVGTLAPIEITQAEAGVASQEEGVIVAEEAVENAEDELLRLLAIPGDDPRWNEPILPTDDPVFAPREIDLEQAIEQALESRPEMASALQDLRNRELSERAARNAARHGLDLSLNFSPEGNSFLVEELPGGDPIGSVGDTYDELLDAEFFQWSGSITYSIPIHNRAAKAGYRIATLNREKSEIALQNRRQDIKVEVRQAVRAVDSGGKRVSAARANVVLQGKKLEAEQKKFENGMSTSFEVLTFQNDLADAELSEIRALVDYNKALVALERVTGTLLPARDLSLGP